MLDALRKTPGIDKENLLELFVAHGKNWTLAWVDENFSVLHEFSDDDYYNSIKKYAELYISVLEEYQQLGCLTTSNSVDDSCVEKYPPNETRTSILQEISNLQNSQVLTKSFLVNNLQQDCWEIWDLIGEDDA